MGTPPFTTAITLPTGLELLASDARARPSDAERVQQLGLQLVMQAGTPPQFGAWGGDRYEQTNHYTGVVALAIRPYLNAARAAKFIVQRRKQNPQDGVVSKSMPTGHYASDDEYEPADPDHPLCKIVQRPNGDRGRWSLPQEAAFLTLQYMLTDDAPVWTPCGSHGKPVQFFALVSATTQLVYPAGAHQAYPKGAYRVTPYTAGSSFGLAGGLYSWALLPAEEVARLTGESPYYRGAGHSRLFSGAKEVDVLEAITKSRYSFFTEGPRLDAVVLMPGSDLETTTRLNELITQKHGGADKHGRRFLILGGGAVTDKMAVQPIGMNATEMDFLQSFEQTASIVGAIFNVPKPILGLTDSSSYATLYAAKQQFYELGLIPFFLRMGDFLTQALAEPWSEYPGEYKIEVEPPPLDDVEMKVKELEYAFQNDAISVNEYRRATGRTPLPEGDVPKSVYTAVLQQKFAPPPVAAPAMAEGEQAPEEAGADGSADTPEATQDAVVSAALASMGLGAQDDAGQQDATPQADVMQKSRQQRSEGERWQSGGKWYTKKNGKIVETAAPGTAKPVASGQQPATPEATGAQPTGEASPPSREQLHAKIAATKGAKAFGFSLENLAKLPEAAVKTIAAQLGIIPAESVIAPHAANVQAASPTAQDTLSKAKQWASQMAAKHADRVAQHFGVSREQAQAILQRAIVMTAEHALKNGGSAGANIKLGGKTLKVGVKQKQAQNQPGPTSGAVPHPANPDGKGSRPPVAKAMDAGAMNSLTGSEGGFLVEPKNRLKRKRKPRGCVSRVLKALDGE